MAARGSTKRLYQILDLLRKRHHMSLKDLQDKLIGLGHEVSKRTIERDIAAIRDDHGVSIVYDKQKNSYYIDEEKSLDSESFFRYIEIVNTADLLKSSLSKSKETLQYISFDSPTGHTGLEHLHLYLSAIKEHRIIMFRHNNFYHETEVDYRLKPYLIKEYQNRWYIVGLPNNQTELRTFGIDRISNLEVTDETFAVNTKIDAKGMFDLTIGLTYSKHKAEKILLSFTPFQGKYVKSLPLHHSQEIIQDDDDACVIELFVTPNFELEQKILMCADQVKVLEPQSLVEKIKAHYSKALSRYK